MKISSQTIWSIAGIVVLLIIAGIIAATTNPNNKIPLKKIVEEAANSVSYTCDSSKSMTVRYSDESAGVSLSDGRNFVLPQIQSGSGTQYENNNVRLVTKGPNAFLAEGDITTYANCISGDIESSSGDTQVFTDSSKTFTFIYPNTFSISGGGVGMTENWRQESAAPGTILAQVNVPKSIMPNTNFSEAKLVIGTSSNPEEIAACERAPQGVVGGKMTASINGVSYTKYISSDAGAGNLYETTSYRTIRDNACFVIEYTIHSTNIGNYDPDSGIAPFDKTRIINQLEGIITTFQFL